jgi:hypothetical protein
VKGVIMREIEMMCPFGIIQTLNYAYQKFSSVTGNTRKIRGTINLMSIPLQNSKFFEFISGYYHQTKPFNIEILQWEVEYVDAEKSPAVKSQKLISKQLIENVILDLTHVVILNGETILDRNYPYQFTGEIK